MPEVAEKRDAARCTLHRLLVHAVKRLPCKHAALVGKVLLERPETSSVGDLSQGKGQTKSCRLVPTLFVAKGALLRQLLPTFLV